jgi:hypothetical protein
MKAKNLSSVRMVHTHNVSYGTTSVLKEVLVRSLQKKC